MGARRGEKGRGEKKKNIFPSWAQNNIKITGTFAKEGASLGKGLGGGDKVSVSKGPKGLGWLSASGEDGKHQKWGAKQIYGSNTGV